MTSLLSRTAKRAVALVATTSLAILGLVALGPPAAADVLDPVAPELTATRVNGDPLTELDKNGSFRLTIDFQLEAPLTDGDTFSLAFPPELRGTPVTRPLRTEPTVPGELGELIGSCTVTLSAFECELDGDFENWEGLIDLSVFFQMVATETSDEETFPFVWNGDPEVVTYVTIPGGINPADDTSFPGNPRKWGQVDTTNPGRLAWDVWVPLSTVVGESISITDMPDGGQRLSRDAGVAAIGGTCWWVAEDDWNAADPWSDDTNHVQLYGDDFEVEELADPYRFTIDYDACTGPNDEPATLVLIQYWTDIPPGTVVGDEFTNSIEGLSRAVTHTISYDFDAGGTGNGNAIPDLLLTKRVTGDGEVPAGVEFSFEIACLDPLTDLPLPGSPYARSVVADETTSVVDLPVGSVCTITETQSHGASSVSFSGTEDGTFTVQSTADIEVIATNTFDPPATGGFALTKLLSDPYEHIEPGQEFTFEYVVTSPDEVDAPAERITIVPGDPAVVVTGIELGSVVTLTEVDLPILTGGYVWFDPWYSDNGFEITQECGTEDVPVSDECTFDVLVENILQLPQGGFSVTKVLDDVANLLPDAEFTVEYTVTPPGVAGTTAELTVAAGGDATIVPGIPVGSTVTLEEIDLPALPDGYSWGDPSFSDDSFEITEVCESPQLVAAAEEEPGDPRCDNAVEITLTNTYTGAPPTTAPPTTEPPTTEPPTTEPPTTEPPTTEPPTTAPPTTEPPTTEPPTTAPSTTAPPTTEPPTTEPPTTEPPTTAPPTTAPPTATATATPTPTPSSSATSPPPLAPTTTPPVTPVAPSTSPSTPPRLPSTGSSTLGLGLAGILLVAVGGVVVLVRRRATEL